MPGGARHHRYAAPMPTRVLVAEDNVLLRDGLTRLIDAAWSPLSGT